MNKKEINSFIELGNSYHPTIKFTSEISDKEIIFLDTCVYKGERFKERIRSRRANALQTSRNFPIYTFLLLPPSRRQEKLYQRRSLKQGVILYNEAEVFSLSITNPNGRPMLPFDWLIHSSLILAICHSILFLCRFSAVEK